MAIGAETEVPTGTGEGVAMMGGGEVERRGSSGGNAATKSLVGEGGEREEEEEERDDICGGEEGEKRFEIPSDVERLRECPDLNSCCCCWVLFNIFSPSTRKSGRSSNILANS